MTRLKKNSHEHTRVEIERTKIEVSCTGSGLILDAHKDWSNITLLHLPYLTLELLLLKLTGRQ